MTEIQLTSVPYTPPRKANPLEPAVAQAVDKDKAAGATLLHSFIVPEGMAPGYAKVQLQKAAREAGLSARTPVDEATKDGHKFGFTLHPRKVRTVKDGASVEADEANAAEADTTAKG